MRIITLAVSLAVSLAADGTLRWEHNRQADFEKGKLERLSLRNDGKLSLAPRFEELGDASAAYLWAVAEDSKGRVYFGGGGVDSAVVKLWVKDGAAKAMAAAELPGFEIHAIAIDSVDRVYAATSPDGKVYRILADGKSEVFYDPKEKYIWSMVFDAAGNLYVATGDKGRVHKVTPQGSGSLFFETEEAHARSLAIDRKGNLYTGTEPGGLILRISAAGEGFVLHQSGKREVTSIAVDANGNIYAAATGTRQAQAAPPPPAPPPPPQTPPRPAGQQGQAAVQPLTPAPIPSQTSAAGGSEVVRIAPDGFPLTMWSHASEVAYAIAFDAQGRAVVGTGNRGAIYRLETELVHALLVSASPTQVTGLHASRSGRIYAVTGNIGKLFRLGPEAETSGTYESEVLDAGNFSQWGRVLYRASAPGGVKLETRSGNLNVPQKNWSRWQAVTLPAEAGRIESPASRYLQYKLTLTSSAVISGVDVAYRPANVAPVIEIVEATPANYRFPPQSLTLTPSTSLTLPPLGRSGRSITPLSTGLEATTMNYAKGYIGARWLARDTNGDALTSLIEIRSAKESGWKNLKDDVRERQFTFDSTAFPDGEYLVRVTISDKLDNPPATALSATLTSEPFLIDNTPPAIESLAVLPRAGAAEARWRARDAWTDIRKAEYSLDGGDWIVVLPTTGISDSKSHDYVLAIGKLASGEHSLAIRVTDAQDNTQVEKAVFRVP